MKAFKKKDPKSFEVHGHVLQCPVCSNKTFWSRKVLLNSTISTFFQLDWTDRSATCFICSDCSYIFWFLA